MKTAWLACWLACAAGAEPTVAFRAHAVGDGLKGGYQVAALDINRDGRPDLVALASGLTELVWFENPSRQRHVLATGLSRMINLVSCSADASGAPEIVVAHEFATRARNSAGIVTLLRAAVRQPVHGPPGRLTACPRLIACAARISSETELVSS